MSPSLPVAVLPALLTLCVTVVVCVCFSLEGFQGFMDASSVRPVDLLPEDEMQSRLPWTEGLEELGETPYDPRAAHPSEVCCRPNLAPVVGAYCAPCAATRFIVFSLLALYSATSKAGPTPWKACARTWTAAA